MTGATMMRGGRTGKKLRRALAATEANDSATLMAVTTVKTELNMVIAGTSIVRMGHGNITTLKAVIR